MASTNDFSYLSILTFSCFRSIVHDSKIFNDPMKYQPERYLKDGILNPDVMDTDSIAFGFGRRFVVYYPYPTTYTISSRLSSPEYVQEDT